ncbi:hypothetical protein [uncultured Cytophaga sp.]|uniref:hypothetical protein n=1 Tax=uncultured Cytophaga sp. TaxID=160238 RepID=UPI002606AD97|nr:hypothetical protein [uncultured Cytophaga sp.]
MEFPIEHFSVNWIDGMKISKDHFIDTNKYVVDLIRSNQSTYINSFNYGLCIPEYKSEESIEIQVSESAENTLKITLQKCTAITSGGFKIKINQNNNNDPALTKYIQKNQHVSSNKSIETRWFEIVLLANPYKRKPIGIPSIEENPPRHPSTEVSYEIEIIPTEEVSINELGPYSFLIGRMKSENGIVSFDKTYTPACTSISSHKHLIQFHEECISYIQKLHETSYKIIQKIHKKNKPSAIAKNVQILCEQTTAYISSIYFILLNELPESTPIKLINCISTLSSIQYRTYQCLAEEDREELFKYFFEWTELTPKRLDQLLALSSQIKYDHNNIQASIKSSIDFLIMTDTVWSKMNALDFIGQRKENIVVTKETVQIKEEAPKKRWSILD